MILERFWKISEALKDDMENNRIILKICSESIYLHSIATLSFSSGGSFVVELPSTLDLIQVFKGKEIIPDNQHGKGKVIQAQKIEKDNYSLEVSVIGLFNERTVKWNGEELGNHYGMRFYPFISSIIRGKIYCSCPVENISIILPNSFRFIFADSDISQNNVSSVLRHSYGDDYSTYVFSWDDEIPSSEDYQLFADVPVRLGARSLLRIVRFPIYYWIGALLGIALLSFTDNISVVIGSVAASWVFMLKRWDSSSLPQSDTILTFFYLIFGALLGIWGVLWKLIGWNALYMAIPILILVFLVFKAVKHFDETGELPQSFAKAYAEGVIRKDRRRERESRRNVSPGRHDEEKKDGFVL